MEYEIRRVLPVPKALSADRQWRSEELVEISILTRLRLYNEQPGLYMETELDNTAWDHKLSVVFPLSINVDMAWVDEAFAVLPRDLDLPDSTGWVEDANPLMHQRAFTDVNTAGYGLAVLNRGLPAVEVTRTVNGTQVSLTLLRSVGWLSRDDLATRRVAAGPLLPTPGAQCLGEYHYEYALLPHSGGWEMVYPWAYRYINPLLAVRADTHEGLDLHDMNITRDDPARVKAIPFPRQGRNPGQVSFFSTDAPELVLSALYRAGSQPEGSPGQSFFARFYNIADHSIQARFKSYRPLRAVWQTNLNEQRQQELVLQDDHSFQFTFGKNQIVTFELEPIL